MKYEPMVSPFNYDDFTTLKKKQAEEYFQWYIGEISHRLEIFAKYLESEGENILLDFSEQSLIPLWEWYEKQITLVKKTEEEIEDEKSRFPWWVAETLSTEKISSETLKYVMDIAIYFAEVVRRQAGEKIYWGYFTKPKSRMSVNTPVLLGFVAGMDLDPRLIVMTCTSKSSKERDKERLYKSYKVWMKKIP